MNRARRPASRRPGRGGFTLVETLAALVVFGFIVAGLAAGVRMGLLAFRVQTQTAARDADLDEVSRALVPLINNILPGDPADPPAVAGTAHALAMVTTLPVRIGAVPTRRASVRLLLRDGALTLVLTPAYHAARLGPLPPPVTLVLVGGVSALTIGYWRDSSGTWVSGWSAAAPPGLIRITLAFTDGRRHWPPIIAAPLLSRYAG